MVFLRRQCHSVASHSKPIGLCICGIQESQETTGKPVPNREAIDARQAPNTRLRRRKTAARRPPPSAPNKPQREAQRPLPEFLQYFGNINIRYVGWRRVGV